MRSRQSCPHLNVFQVFHTLLNTPAKYSTIIFFLLCAQINSILNNNNKQNAFQNVTSECNCKQQCVYRSLTMDEWVYLDDLTSSLHLHVPFHTTSTKRVHLIIYTEIFCDRIERTHASRATTKSRQNDESKRKKDEKKKK